MGWLAAAFAWLWNALTGGGVSAPSPDARAAAATVALNTTETANVQITEARAASDAAVADQLQHPGSLRDDDGFRRD